MSTKAKIPDDILKILDAVEEENRRRRTSLVQRIVEWNRDRYLFFFDANQEVHMLSVCANDFFYSRSLIERLNALADFEFVWFGAASKYGAMVFANMEEMAAAERHYQSLFSWKESVYTIIIENVVAELSEHCAGGEEEAEWIALLLERILTIVIEANEKRPFGESRDMSTWKKWLKSSKREIELTFNDWLLEMEEEE